MSEEVILKITYDDGIKKFQELDFYHGTKSLAAISEAFILATNAALNKETLSKTTAAKGFQSAMRKNFKGSYIQTIALIIEEETTLAQYKNISFEGYAEFLKIVIGSAVGHEHEATKRGSKRILKEIDDLETLIQRIENVMLDIHSPIKYQGLNIDIKIGPRKIAQLNEQTLSYIDDEEKSKTIEKITVAVSKFNGRTGTGRFIFDLDGESFPFYPVKIKISPEMMSLLSASLNDMTNGLMTLVSAYVTTVHSSDGRLKRFILHEVRAKD